MDIALDLLKAPHVGVREFKAKMSSLLDKRRTLVVTEHGEPTSVVVPYQDMMELLDILEEINDPQTRQTIALGRKSIKENVKGIPVFPQASRKN